MGNLFVALRGIALLALLWFAWQQAKGHREVARAERDRAVADGCIVYCGDRLSCADVTSILARQGIRSWTVNHHGQREIVVLHTDATAARAALAAA